MQPPLFYQSEIHSEFLTLPEDESRHCIRVLRMKAGDAVHVTDGFGNLYKTEIAEASPKKTLLRINETICIAPDRDFRIHMAVAPTKNLNRFEWFLEKATEMGIDEITPLICHHSERTVLKTERLQKVVISAMKQSLKYWLPRLNEPIKFSDFLPGIETPLAFIAYCNETDLSLVAAYPKKSDVLILIGPEGDFTPEEIKIAKTKGIQSVHLGESRLRTETAALAACHTIHVLNAIH